MTIAGRIPVALLAYLAVTGQRHSRDALATFFWPEARQPRTQLRNNLWIISEALGTAGRQWLQRDRDTISLVPDDRLRLDVATFQHAVATSEKHASSCTNQLCVTCVSALEEAVALYQDDLLAGFSLWD
ncbi:MAG: hypothetical protein KDE19_12855, partial [Caldilineaceae bacterium]|nr:hypothetical protein [Caldilineaceae bacterium]